MLDYKDERVLQYILNNCKDEYKLFELEDFAEADWLSVISKLKNGSYITVKYQSESNVLLKATEKAKAYFSSKKNSVLSEMIFLRKTAVNAAIGGFLGAVSASVLCFLLWWVLYA